MFKNRPADNRPRTQKATTGRNAVPAPDIRPLFAEFLSPRIPYEALRSSGASFFEQVLLIDHPGGPSRDPAKSRRRGR